MTSALSPRARSEYVATVLQSGAAGEVTPGSTLHRTGPIARALGTVRHATARMRGRQSSVGFLAVIRRADGAFVVNVDAGTRDHAADLLHLVREQLATMTVSQFERAWGIDKRAETIIQRHLDRQELGAPIRGRRSLRSAG
ncbi:hypothetical protein ISU10_19615 [Nocardioides agariphilus]|jgi:hypothetical protein|uniref:Uncharacterized protein n=1 Tax=Nocardioides agariphilus TaxID=433664 RepID=A0A930VS90_9ACTN|nr:hypothetical protein [Nocardioides agariphilus]MBF4769986.1 hypothetical protein [Nocardioides agariphilus]